MPSKINRTEIFNVVSNALGIQVVNNEMFHIQDFIAVDVQGDFAVISPLFRSQNASKNIAFSPKVNRTVGPILDPGFHTWLFASETTFIHIPTETLVFRSLPEDKVCPVKTLCTDELVSVNNERFNTLESLMADEQIVNLNISPCYDGEIIYLWKFDGIVRFSTKNLVDGIKAKRQQCTLTHELYTSLGGPDPNLVFSDNTDNGNGTIYTFKVIAKGFQSSTKIPIGEGMVEYIGAHYFNTCEPVYPGSGAAFTWGDFDVGNFYTPQVPKVIETEEPQSDEDDDGRIMREGDAFIEESENVEDGWIYPFYIPTTNSLPLPPRGNIYKTEPFSMISTIGSGCTPPLICAPTNLTISEADEVFTNGFHTVTRRNACLSSGIPTTSPDEYGICDIFGREQIPLQVSVLFGSGSYIRLKIVPFGTLFSAGLIGNSDCIVDNVKFRVAEFWTMSSNRYAAKSFEYQNMITGVTFNKLTPPPKNNVSSQYFHPKIIRTDDKIEYSADYYDILPPACRSNSSSLSVMLDELKSGIVYTKFRFPTDYPTNSDDVTQYTKFCWAVSNYAVSLPSEAAIIALDYALLFIESINSRIPDTITDITSPINPILPLDRADLPNEASFARDSFKNNNKFWEFCGCRPEAPNKCAKALARIIMTSRLTDAQSVSDILKNENGENIYAIMARYALVK